jgi:hypothetical protein
VGILTFAAPAVGEALLTYNVEGVSIRKSIARQTFSTENIAGTYLGVTVGTWSNCAASRNGASESAATFLIAQDGNSMQIREEAVEGVCAYSGSYSQNGRLGTIYGNSQCRDSLNRSFTAREVQVTSVGFAMKTQSQYPDGCQFIGRVAAVRRGP